MFLSMFLLRILRLEKCVSHKLDVNSERIVVITMWELTQMGYVIDDFVFVYLSYLSTITHCQLFECIGLTLQ